jgi:hypothetical protein
MFVGQFSPKIQKIVNVHSNNENTLTKKKKQKKKNLKIESGQIKKLKEKLKIYRSFLI